MASAPTFDIAEFLQPISAENAVGEDLREDYSPQSAYFEIKDAQTSARTDERRRRESFDEVPDTEFRRDDWKPVYESAKSILINRSKDLEVTAWTIEALLRLHGFAGIRDGFRLLRDLAEKFWDDIYPRPDEDGLLTKVAAITSLNGENGPGTLIWPISNIPIFGTRKWGTWQCRQAQSLENSDPKTLEKRVAEGAVSPEMLRTAIKETSPAFFRNLLGDMEEALAAVVACGELFREKCGVDDAGYEATPGTQHIEQAIKDAMSALRSVTAGMGISTAEVAPESPAATDLGADAVASDETTQARTGPTTPMMGVTAAVQSREQAYRAIQELADYFRKTEPHSPTAYLLDRAVRWGRLPLPALLEELLSDSNIKQDLFRVIGMGRGSE